MRKAIMLAAIAASLVGQSAADVFVERDAQTGAVKGVYLNRQPGYAEEAIADDHPEVLSYRAAVAARRLVPKSLIINRLSDAQVEAAIGAMSAKQRERWRAPDSPAVYADDAEVRALLAAIGADPDAILAPP